MHTALVCAQQASQHNIASKLLSSAANSTLVISTIANAKCCVAINQNSTAALIECSTALAVGNECLITKVSWMRCVISCLLTQRCLRVPQILRRGVSKLGQRPETRPERSKSNTTQ
jgi:hypothetical protein